jgi:hypothetical protein
MALRNDINAEVIGDLVAYSSAVDGQGYIVFGETTRGDRSSRLYFYHSTSTATPDGDSIVEAVGMGAGRYIKVPIEETKPDWNAGSGYAQILNKPSIPAAQVQCDWNQASSGAVDFIKNKPAINAVTINNTVTRSITGSTYTISSTLNARVYYTVKIQCTASIGSASAGAVLLQYSTNGGSTWIDVSGVENSNTVTLAIVLNSVTIQTGVISGEVPANALVRMTQTTSGTTTISYIRGQEVTY